jgi:hypothetical protein
MPERIQRRRTPGWAMPANTRYVGRGTKHGNPWRIEREDGSNGYDVNNPHRHAHAGHYDNLEAAREAATARFGADLDERLAERPDLREAIRAELGGMNLACWCPLPEPGQPDHCHAAVLLQLAAEEDPDA